MVENVAVIGSHALASHNIHHGFHPIKGSLLTPGVMNAVCFKGALSTLPKKRHEEDPRYRGLVSYILFRHSSWYFSYARDKGSDARLEKNFSLGIGGHVNESDLKKTIEAMGMDAFYDKTTAFETILAASKVAAVREINEEVDSENYVVHDGILKFLGVLNDESNDVGKVHLGMIFEVDWPHPYLKMRPESCAKDGDFRSPVTLANQYENMENWSKILSDQHLKLPAPF